MINVEACKKCGRLFKNFGEKNYLCPTCAIEENKKFTEAKDYVWDHKGCTISELAEACDIEEYVIKQWLKEERLAIIPDESGSCIPPLECERCGVPLWSGKLCTKCMAEQKDMLKQMTDEIKKTTKSAAPVSSRAGAKMRFVKKKK